MYLFLEQKIARFDEKTKYIWLSLSKLDHYWYLRSGLASKLDDYE